MATIFAFDDHRYAGVDQVADRKPAERFGDAPGRSVGFGHSTVLQIQTMDRARAPHAVRLIPWRISKRLASGPKAANDRSRVILAPRPQDSHLSLRVSPIGNDFTQHLEHGGRPSFSRVHVPYLFWSAERVKAELGPGESRFASDARGVVSRIAID
jgi:hypothetical protein